MQWKYESIALPKDRYCFKRAKTGGVTYIVLWLWNQLQATGTMNPRVGRKRHVMRSCFHSDPELGKVSLGRSWHLYQKNRDVVVSQRSLG